MSFSTNWMHKHFIHKESRRVIMGFDNRINMVRYFRETITADCTYGANCPILFQNQGFWPAPYQPDPFAINPLSPPYQPQFHYPRFATPTLLPNDTVEFNEPYSMPRTFPHEGEDEENVPHYPTNRTWENIVGFGRLPDSSKKMRFKVMSYNVLSQIMLNSNIFMYNSCKQEDLVWEARWERIYNEVFFLSPDIFCLQEVELNHIAFYALFQGIGYGGIFKKKTRDRVDGCAVFFKDSMFSVIEKIPIEFRCDDLSNLRSDSIGIMLKLAPRASPNTQLVVATTHLVRTPSLAATRLAQMRILLYEIDKFAWDPATNQRLPVILAGDFNATPNSNVTNFLDEGMIRIPVSQSLEQLGLMETCEEIDAGPQASQPGRVSTAPVPNGEAPIPVTNAQETRIAHHPFEFSSAYEIDKRGSRTVRWITVDHIYFSSNNLQVVKRLAPPPGLGRLKIPNEVYGSDHLSLAAVFEMVIDGQQ